MEYKGYSGTMHQDKNGHYHGRIVGYSDLTYSGMTIDSFERAFRSTVNDLIKSKRRKKTIFLSILGVLTAFVVLLIATCPNEQAHKDRISTVIKQGMGMSLSGMDEELKGFGSLIQLIGGGIAEYAFDQMLEVNNYFIFSVGTVTMEGETKPMTIGVLGHVFTTISKEEVAEFLK